MFRPWNFLDCQNISPPTDHVLAIQRSGTEDHEITSLAHFHLIPVCQQTPQALLQHSSSNEAAAGSRSARGAAAQRIQGKQNVFN
jgi:hypothetical protein